MFDKEEICELMDKLTIDMLDLMEQKVKCKINIEKCTNDGQLLLAKARYIQGQQTVSISQLPSENSNDFNALSTVSSQIQDTEGEPTKQWNLEIHPVNKENGYIDPLKWFGILVPQSLQLARDKFRKAVELAVECANIQVGLQNVNLNLLRLIEIKGKY